MWRAYIPVKDKTDLDGFPSWLVSFDGDNFIEVRHKPDISRASTMQALWSVTVNGHKRRRGQTASNSLPLEPVTRKEIELVGGAIEVVAGESVGAQVSEEEYEV